MRDPEDPLKLVITNWDDVMGAHALVLVEKDH